MNAAFLKAGSVALALALAGCSLAPEYHVPEMEVPAAFKENGPWRLAKPADALPRGEWWRVFGDPTLDELQAEIAHGNFDLAAAVARYDFYRAYAAELGARQYPEIALGGSALRNRQSSQRPLRGSNQPDVYDAYTLGAATSYEIDLWGRVHNMVASGEALAEAAAAEVESVRLSLHAELASSYFTMRGLDAEIKLLDDAVTAYRRQLELINHRHNQGIVSGLDVSRAKTQLEEARAQAANLRGRRSVVEHAVAVLVGKAPADFSLVPDVQVLVLPEVPVEVPSTLLQRRPDIAAAERRVAAANAEIGVARAAFFPSLSLGAGGGFQSAVSSGLLAASNSFWSIGPMLLLSIFDSGRREAQVAQAEARTAEVSARYRATVLRAFREVEDGLVQLRQLREERESEQAAVQAARHTHELAMNRYREGVVNYLEVVDAETAKLRTERAALDIATRGLLASVGLIRALGGGWQSPVGNVSPAVAPGEEVLTGDS